MLPSSKEMQDIAYVAQAKKEEQSKGMAEVYFREAMPKISERIQSAAAEGKTRCTVLIIKRDDINSPVWYTFPLVKEELQKAGYRVSTYRNATYIYCTAHWSDVTILKEDKPAPPPSFWDKIRHKVRKYL